jgi:hypothetical protein
MPETEIRATCPMMEIMTGQNITFFESIFYIL